MLSTIASLIKLRRKWVSRRVFVVILEQLFDISRAYIDRNWMWFYVFLVRPKRCIVESTRWPSGGWWYDSSGCGTRVFMFLLWVIQPIIDNRFIVNNRRWSRTHNKYWMRYITYIYIVLSQWTETFDKQTKQAFFIDWTKDTEFFFLRFF